MFAGQREDPFYVDLGATFDAINLRVGTGASGGGKDDLAGYAVHSIVLQVPEAHVTRTGKQVHAAHDRDAVVGVWASTERRRLQVTGVGADDGKANASRRRSNGRKRNPWIQVSRLANPLVNEVVIPLGFKDRFNATQPSDDGANFGRFVVEPELAKLLNILFPGLNVPETDRTDIVQAVLQGIPELNQITKDPPPTDTLKINLGTPPAEKGKENRFGVIGGDLAGYPNGRRLGDDVVDIALRVVGGVLKGNPLPLGDGVDQNDVPFLDSFPYVGPPQSGFDSDLKRLEPTHSPTSAVDPK